MAPPPSNPAATRRFLFITGKGGVGKTTVAAAMAQALAAEGKRVLVAMCDTHERLSAMLGAPPIGHDIVEVSPSIWATRIEARRAMEEYGELVIRVGAIARAVFDNQYTASFFRAVPGLHDWAMLGKAWYHTTETDEEGRPRFDVVLFDAPSTGHGLDMLRVPKVILDIVPPGVLRKDAEQAWALFQDESRAGVVVVSLAEDMPTTESIELCASLREELGLPVVALVINAMMEPLFSPAERERFLAQADLLDVGTRYDHAADENLAVAARRAAREVLQERCAERLESQIGLTALKLPFLLEGATTPGGVRQLAAYFKS